MRNSARTAASFLEPCSGWSGSCDRMLHEVRHTLAILLAAQGQPTPSGALYAVTRALSLLAFDKSSLIYQVTFVLALWNRSQAFGSMLRRAVRSEPSRLGSERGRCAGRSCRCAYRSPFVVTDPILLVDHSSTAVVSREEDGQPCRPLLSLLQNAITKTWRSSFAQSRSTAPLRSVSAVFHTAGFDVAVNLPSKFLLE
jgi:hypothetical protein